MSKSRTAKTQTSLLEVVAVKKTHTRPTAKLPDTPILLAPSQQADLLIPRGLVHRQVETCRHLLMDQMTVGTLLVRRDSQICLRNGDELDLLQ